MLTIAPFKGLTYNYLERKDLSALVAPPYDVISPRKNKRHTTRPTRIMSFD
jgi:uncharacterized protein (DUF1015 family)